MSKVYSGEDSNKITIQDLEKNSEGLICLTGGIKGPIGKLLLKNELVSANSTTKITTILKSTNWV